MAKKKAEQAGAQGDVNKSQAIRDYLASNPDAMPRVVAADLKEQGVDVNPQRVSIVKSQLKKAAQEGDKPKRGRRKKAVRAKAASPKASPAKASDDLSFQTLQKAKELSDQLGGVDKAREALAALIQLTQ